MGPRELIRGPEDLGRLWQFELLQSEQRLLAVRAVMPIEEMPTEVVERHAHVERMNRGHRSKARRASTYTGDMTVALPFELRRHAATQLLRQGSLERVVIAAFADKGFRQGHG
jgi:hypothetical protein